MEHMNHFFENIQGWFTFPIFYKTVVSQIPDNSHIIELGVWKGKSVAYMAVEIINSGKKIKFDCIDTWEGDLDIKTTFEEPLLYVKDGVYNLFLKNIDPVRHIINPIKSDFTKASRLYSDNTIDFIFIDGAHDYDNVKNDILTWLPKIKHRGVISGHDIHHKGVWAATKEIFGDNFNFTKEDIWYHRVTK